MQISTFALCDAASVRDNLLHMLGAGITFVKRPSYPAPLLCDLGIVVNHLPSERNLHLKMTLRESGKSQVLAEIEASGSMDMATMDPQAHFGSISLAMDARGVAIPHPGDYVLTASLGPGQGGATLSFSAVLSQEAEQVVDTG